MRCALIVAVAGLLLLLGVAPAEAGGDPALVSAIARADRSAGIGVDVAVIGGTYPAIRYATEQSSSGDVTSTVQAGSASSRTIGVREGRTIHLFTSASWLLSICGLRAGVRWIDDGRKPMQGTADIGSARGIIGPYAVVATVAAAAPSARRVGGHFVGRIRLPASSVRSYAPVANVVPIEIWLDRLGRLSRVRYSATYTKPLRLQWTLDARFVAWDIPVRVTTPLKSEVAPSIARACGP